MSEKLPSTEATKIDLVALRNWHFKASMDADRQPEMRRWHRRQADIISRKLAAQGGVQLPLAKIAMIEILADCYRSSVMRHCKSSEPWDWKLAVLKAQAEIERHGFREP